MRPGPVSDRPNVWREPETEGAQIFERNRAVNIPILEQRVSIVNRNELITKVADSTGFTKTDTSKVLDGVLEAITGAMSGGDEVRLVGFGTFSVTERAASKGRNPRTGEPIDIAARKLPRFKAGTGLKEAVND